MSQQFGESLFWHAFLIVRDREATFHYMENVFGGAAIALRIMQDALANTVRGDDI